MVGILDSAHVTLGDNGHLMVESYDAELHGVLHFMANVTQGRRPLPLRHDYVPVATLRQGFGYTSYLHWYMPEENTRVNKP